MRNHKTFGTESVLTDEEAQVELVPSGVKQESGRNILTGSDSISFLLETSNPTIRFSCSMDGQPSDPCFVKNPDGSRWPQQVYHGLSDGYHQFILYLYEEGRIPRFLSYEFVVVSHPHVNTF